MKTSAWQKWRVYCERSNKLGWTRKGAWHFVTRDKFSVSNTWQETRNRSHGLQYRLSTCKHSRSWMTKKWTARLEDRLVNRWIWYRITLPGWWRGYFFKQCVCYTSNSFLWSWKKPQRKLLNQNSFYMKTKRQPDIPTSTASSVSSSVFSSASKWISSSGLFRSAQHRRHSFTENRDKSVSHRDDWWDRWYTRLWCFATSQMTLTSTEYKGKFPITPTHLTHWPFSITFVSHSHRKFKL